MALAYVGSTADARVTGVATSTSAVTFANAACLAVCNALIFNSGGSTCVVSDAAGTYSTVVTNGTAPDSGSQAHQKYFPNHGSGAHTVTVDPAGSSADIEFWTSEVTGADTSTPLDGDSGQALTGPQDENDGPFNITVTSSGTLDQAANIVFAAMTHTGTGGPNQTLAIGTIQGTNATLIGENESNSGGQCGLVEYRITSASTAVASIAVVSDNAIAAGSFTAGIIHGIYKEAAAAGGGTTWPGWYQTHGGWF